MSRFMPRSLTSIFAFDDRCHNCPSWPGGVAAPKAQMMRWTPPGDMNGIEVPKSSRCVITK